MSAKLERLDATIRGVEHDRPPVTVWTHLVTDHLGPVDAAWVHLAFHSKYDWDFVKVNQEPRLDLPPAQGASWMSAVLSRKGVSSALDAVVRYQQELIAQIRDGTSDPIFDTVFTPTQMLARSIGARPVRELQQGSPDDLNEILTCIADGIQRHLEIAADLGVSGLFFSLNGLGPCDPLALDLDEFDQWFWRHDSSILEAARGLGLRRLLHMHGAALDDPRWRRYSGELWNWEPVSTGLAIESLIQQKQGAVVGGVNHRAIVNAPADDIDQQLGGFLSASGVRSVVGPTCAVPGSVSNRILQRVSRLATSSSHDAS